MTASEAAAARATAAVFAAERRVGSAVLVDSRRLVTAKHVLLRRDPNTGIRALADHVEVEFPALLGSDSLRIPARTVDLGLHGGEADVVVLDLGDDPLGSLPAPVTVWPAARMPGRVKVFGYPLSESSLNGVWREFAVAGPTAAGAVQLDWARDAGTFPGHSGGPVIDGVSHALVGILVEGSEQGRFDRFLPVAAISKVWPQLPRCWLMTGVGQADARSHFTRRSRGQRSAARGGDQFRGRQAALAAISGWLTAEQPPGQPLVVTGQPGAGKSAVLARAALSLEAGQAGPGLAFHAHEATIGDFLTAVADLTGADPPTSADQLIGELSGSPGEPPTLVVVDALDEAASDADRQEITRALADLAVLPGLRVAVATRTLAVSNRFGTDGLLSALGVTGPGSRNLIDLDTGTYFEPGDVREYAAAVLAQDGALYPAPAGAAWEIYRADRRLCARLASVIARRARRNFLVAAMAAVPLSAAPAVVDPAAEGFNPAVIPAGVGEALDKHLGQLPEQRRAGERGLLTALAYGRGSGLEDRRWLAFADALGYLATVADLDIMRRSPAADYLLQTTPTELGTRPLTRLFHQALADELLADRHRTGDESSLLDLLLDEAARTSWANTYLQGYAAEHAIAAGRLDELLDDPHYLVAADPSRLVPQLDATRAVASHVTATVYRQAAHLLAGLGPAAKVSELEMYARYLGHRDLADRIAQVAPDRPWQTHWCQGRMGTGRWTLTGHRDWVKAVATGMLPDGTPVVVSGGRDGTVRIWRLADGAPVGEPLAGDDGGVDAVATGVLPDGTPVIVGGGRDGIRIWRLADGAPVGEPLSGRHRSVNSVAIGVLPDGTPVVVSGGWGGTVGVWRIADGAPVGELLTGRHHIVSAVATGLLPDGTPVGVSSGDGGMVGVWRLADGAPVGEPFTVGDEVRAVATSVLPDGTPVIVGGVRDGIRVWRLADGAPVGEPFTVGYKVRAVATSLLPDGTPVVISGGSDNTVRIWRLPDGAPVGEPLTGNDTFVFAVTAGALPNGTPVVISGGSDKTVRIWRLVDGAAVSEPVTGHGDVVSAVATSVLPDGNPVVVSGGRDGTVRIWRLADGAPVGEPIVGHDNVVSPLATGVLPDGTPLVISGGHDGTVRIWRLPDGAPVGEPLTGHHGNVWAVATGALPDGTPIVISGGEDGTVRIWRVADGAPIGEPLTGHYGTVYGVASGVLPDGTPVVISGGHDGTVRIWRLPDGASIGEPLSGHDGAVWRVATGVLPDGTPVVVSGSSQGTVRIWRPANGAPVGEPLTGRYGELAAVTAGALPDGTPIIVSGGDAMVRIWRLADGAPLEPSLSLPTLIRAIAIHGDHVVTAVGLCVAAHSPTALVSETDAMTAPRK